MDDAFAENPRWSAAQFAFAQAFDELGEKKRDHAKWRIYPRRLIGQIGKAN
jgi:hypothetical protein